MNPHARKSILDGLVFAAVILLASFGLKQAARQGLIEGNEVSTRWMMVFIGFYFAWTGNELPKTVVRQATARCDGARSQAFRRFAGWMWVLSGAAFAAAWLFLPVAVAKPLSTAVMLTTMLVVGVQVFRLRRSH